MELNYILNNHKKSVRKLRHLWQRLVKTENFLVPKTIDDFKQFGFLAPRIKIDSTEGYFNEESKTWLEEFANTIYDIPVVKDTVSYDFIYRTTISFIEKTVYERIKHSLKPNPNIDIETIIRSVLNGRKTYQYFFIIEGIELKEVESLVLGDVEIFFYSEAFEKDLRKYRDKNNDNGFFDENISPFVKKHFVNKMCVRTTTFAEEKRAKDIATKKIKEAINVLRFILCVVKHETIYDNRVKINLRGESYDLTENAMRINQNDETISIMVGGGRKPLFDLTVNADLLSQLKENCFLDDLLFILRKSEKTELEKSILTSMYWIGEAQNEFIYESAFIKYWTGLETIFTPEIHESFSKHEVLTLLSKVDQEGIMIGQSTVSELTTLLRKIGDERDGISESLGRGIAIFLVFGGYAFAKAEEIQEVHNKVKRLYDKRCDVIHHGLYEVVTPAELGEVCKYAIWTVLTCLELKTRGFEKLEQIRTETNRLYETSIRHSRYQTNQIV